MKKIMQAIGAGAMLAAGACAGAAAEWVHEEKRIDKFEDDYKKMQTFYNLLVQWLALQQEGRNLSEYFEFNGYKKVALYGMRELGERFVDELRDTGIEVCYLVDRNADSVSTDLPKYKPDEKLPKADVMVVSAVYYFQDIQEKMEICVDFPIISLEDVVYGLA